VQRSQNLVVIVLCPHFQKPVRATRNQAIDRLVDCESKDECVTRSTDERGAERREYPFGCPVFRR
jgi:hypothetical protein